MVKYILFCWEHKCIQTILINIMKMGNKTINNLDLPYWTLNNY